MQQTIGVVVPVFRVEPFVADTMRVLSAQTRPPDQVVLVDDCGGDDSVEIALKAAAELGLQVEVVSHESNLGLAAARNHGLARLRTDLVWFLDSDDLADPTFLEHLAIVLEREDADFSMCRTARVTTTDEMREVVEPSWAGESVITGNEFARRLLRTEVRGYACNKVFRRELLGDDPFPVGRTYEDIGPALSYGLTAQRVALVDAALYRYRDNDTSISRRFGTHTTDLLAVEAEIGQILERHGRSGAAWRADAARFRVEGIVLPVANMAARALEAGPDDATAARARRDQPRPPPDRACRPRRPRPTERLAHRRGGRGAGRQPAAVPAHPASSLTAYDPRHLVSVGKPSSDKVLASVPRSEEIRVYVANRPEMPTVTVVVPAFNEARNLEIMLPSLPPVHEVIVVDGGSADDTADTVARVMPSARFLQQTRRGKGTAVRTVRTTTRLEAARPAPRPRSPRGRCPATSRPAGPRPRPTARPSRRPAARTVRRAAPVPPSPRTVGPDHAGPVPLERPGGTAPAQRRGPGRRDRLPPARR